jgi:phosphoribosylformylglycinamidine synthase
MNASSVKALVLAGYGMNCDLESQFVLNKAGALADRLHVNRLIELEKSGQGLDRYHILLIGGGFAYADDHGAGLLLGLKLRARLGDAILKFIADGKLIIGVCNGFQALVNMGLLPGFGGDYQTRNVALAANDCNTYRDQWVHLKVDPQARCVFTQGLDTLEIPVRHGEGKFYAPPDVMDRLKANGQAALRYGRPETEEVRRRDAQMPPTPPRIVPANGVFPYNPNGALDDIAGICDETGRVFGLMPHPEAFHSLYNHPDWTRRMDHPLRWGRPLPDEDGDGMKIFRNAVRYVAENF